jgi:fluoride ion exporter CrcB/FEX
MQIIYIGLGGFIGASLWFVVSKYLSGILSSFPLGTLTVNVLRSF